VQSHFEGNLQGKSFAPLVGFLEEWLLLSGWVKIFFFFLPFTFCLLPFTFYLLPFTFFEKIILNALFRTNRYMLRKSSKIMSKVSYLSSTHLLTSTTFFQISALRNQNQEFFLQTSLQPPGDTQNKSGLR
jgi:hypothetical protein